MQFVIKALAAPILVAVVFFGGPLGRCAADDRYAAIALSKTTGATGYSYGFYSLRQAKNHALEKCDADDAEIVGWSRNSWSALATGADLGAYGFGWGTSEAIAKANARRECRKHTTDVKIVVIVFTGLDDD